MNRLVLTREPEEEGAVMGIIEPLGIYTIERPWVPSAPGGEPYKSSVPAGIYKLVKYIRPSGEEVPALINHGLGVFRYPKEQKVAGAGRYFILIHAGNWVHDVIGCIAPGLGRATSSEGPMTTRSKPAMKVIMDYMITNNWNVELEIIGETGYEF